MSDPTTSISDSSQHPSKSLTRSRRLRLRLTRCLLRCNQYYWRLPAKPRRLLGWCLVCCLLLTLGGVGYGLYRGGVAVWHWTSECTWFQSADEEAGDDDTFYHVGKPKRDYSKATRLDKRRFNYDKDFPDLNEVQLVAAKRMGIPPIANREAAEKMKNSLVEIRDCQYYKLDRLTHSIPYLTPEAADLLIELGRRFQDYSESKSRFIITSVLRTEADVKHLRRSGNGNASKNSCHRYATTFDITYNRFDCRGRREARLKEDLARALHDLRVAGYCYVKYEHKQACFHVTIRP